MRALSTAVEAAIQAEIVSRTVAVEMDFPSGFVRVNGSPGDFVILGQTYLGIGGLGAISAAEESAELRAYGLTLALSGIPRDMVAVALGQAYQGRRVTVREVVFDTTTWLPLADPVVVFRGRMDTMDVRLGEMATITIKAENRLADWERPRIRRYTDEDQQLAHPGDRGFRFVSSTAEKEIIWPGRGAV